MLGPLPINVTTTLYPLSFVYNSGRNWTTTPTPDPEAVINWLDKVGAVVADIMDGLWGPPEQQLYGKRFQASTNDRSFNEDGRTMRWVGFFRRLGCQNPAP
jgi:hypothetical protein